MSDPAPNDGQRIPPDEILDALFDGELSPQARRDVLGAVRHDASARRDLERTTRLLTALRTPPEAPDLTGRILASADGRRRFVPTRLRRLTRAGRVGVVALALVAMLGVAAGRRAWPERMSLEPQQTPLADVNDAFRQDTADGVRTLQASVQQVRLTLSAFADAETCTTSLRIESNAPRARTLTAGLTNAGFGLAAQGDDAPASIRCGSPRLGAGAINWTTESGECVTIAPSSASDRRPRILP